MLRYLGLYRKFYSQFKIKLQLKIKLVLINIYSYK